MNSSHLFKQEYVIEYEINFMVVAPGYYSGNQNLLVIKQ